jgi:hypothetical protein
MQIRLYKEVSFDASHRLLHYRGKCHNLHGHRWKVEIWISGETDEHPYTRGIASDGLAVIHDNRGITPLKTAISLEEIPELKERMIQNLNLLKKTD